MLAGIFAAAFAFSTYNLFRLSMANLDFIQKYRLLAVQEGALRQSFEIAIGGALALFFFLGFKVCERELVTRYFNWQDKE